MTEGRTRELGVVASMQTKRDSKQLSSPAYGDEAKDPSNLHANLDDAHMLDTSSKAELETSSNDSSLLNFNAYIEEKQRGPVQKKRFQIKTSHWKKPVEGKSVCHQCGCKLGARNGIINCRRCGELFCLKHCKNVIKLNENADYDPVNGEWCKCCNKCFKARPGYDDYGLTKNITGSYISIRKSKNEDRELITLQLENRLLRLINGIIQICVRHQSSLFGTFKKKSEISELERSVVEWKDDQTITECSLCYQPFGLLIRKHHCRLCGRVVCDRESTRCSSELPLLSLMSAAPDLPFNSVSDLKDLSDLNTGIRICSSCLRYVFAKRKMAFNRITELPEILQQYEQLHNVETVIRNLLPQFTSAINDVHADKAATDELKVEKLTRVRRQLLQNMSLYDSLSKHLVRMEVSSVSERKIQQSISLHASSFIDEHMLPLKKIPEVLNPYSEVLPANKSSDLYGNDLTISEVKKFREELMVLKEQRFLVDTMLKASIKERRFEEAAVLKSNMSELEENIGTLEGKLGDEGFD